MKSIDLNIGVHNLVPKVRILNVEFLVIPEGATSCLMDLTPAVQFQHQFQLKLFFPPYVVTNFYPQFTNKS
jgi:hypothetical protein